MRLETTRFGAIDIDPDSVITLTQPILGFAQFRRYVLLPGPSEFLTWMQSTEAGDLAFILMDPRSVVPDYTVAPKNSELAELAATSTGELDVYTLVVVPRNPAQIRTNLKAPILINPKQRLGKQTILEQSKYPVQFFLAQAPHREQEVSNARSDA